MNRITRTTVAACLLLASAMPLAAQDDGAEEPDEETLTEEPVVANPDFAAVQAGALEAWVEPDGSTASQEEILAAVNYTIGMATYVTYHELGHGLVHNLDLPVLGKEEDAVDIFAAIYMLAEDDDPILDDMIGSVVEARFDQDAANGGYFLASDTHAPTEARAYEVLCILYGSDPEGWQEVADESEMPKTRQESCPFEYAQAEKSWDTLLDPHTLPDGELSPEGITVEYGDPLPEHEIIAAILKSSGMGEAVAAHIESMFRLPKPITLKFYSCGEMNADMNYQTNTARLCYEYADFFRQNAIKARAGIPEPK